MATEVCTEDLVDMDEDVDMEEQARNRGTPVDMVTAAVVGLACGYFMVQLLTLIWFRRERAFRPKQPHILVPQLLAAMVFSIMLLVVNGHFFRGSGWLSYCQLWDVWGFWISLSAWLNSQALRVVKVHQVRVLELEENLSAAIGKANSARGARRHWLWKKARPPLHNLRAAFYRCILTPDHPPPRAGARPRALRARPAHQHGAVAPRVRPRHRAAGQVPAGAQGQLQVAVRRRRAIPPRAILPRAIILTVVSARPGTRRRSSSSSSASSSSPSSARCSSATR